MKLEWITTESDRGSFHCTQRDGDISIGGVIWPCSKVPGKYDLVIKFCHRGSEIVESESACGLLLDDAQDMAQWYFDWIRSEDRREFLKGMSR